MYTELERPQTAATTLTEGARETTMPLVSVVMLSHNRPDYIGAALDSVMAQDYENFEVVVVDNRSATSEAIRSIVERHPSVRLVLNRENLGFTGGMNVGIKAALGAYVYLTLDDVLLAPDCITSYVEHALKAEGEGLFSGVLYNESDGAIRCAGGEFELAGRYRKSIYDAGEKKLGRAEEPYDVGFVPGGVIFSRLDYMRRLGGFREDFFMYSEDVEMCARVLARGDRITIVPRARAYVVDAPHSFTDAGIGYHKVKNFLAVYMLHARWRVLPAALLRYGPVYMIRAGAADRRQALPMLRAMFWLALNTPRLLRERAALKGTTT